MRVATKIATSSGVAIVLLMVVVAWDLSLVDRLAAVNQDLSRIDFRTSTISLRQARILNQIDEFTRKHHVTGDPAYADRLIELRTSFAGEMAELRALDHSSRVRAEVGKLAREWEAYWRLMADYQKARLPRGGRQEARERELLDGVTRLAEQLEQVREAAHLSVVEQAIRSLEVSARARRISWGIAACALLLGVLILWLTIRSINRPLTALTEGTQAVADGEFSVRLAARGRGELSRLAESFNQMVLRLGEAERAKKDFLSHVSHELKTPLASMQETNELLLEQIPGALNDRQMRFLRLNLDSSKRLSAMISKLLDLSQLEAGVMDYDFRRQDLVGLTQTVVASFEARARDQSVRMLLQAPARSVPVACDRDRIIQVLENLIDNALKFSPREAAVEIRVIPPGQSLPKTEKAGKGMAIVEVADAGPGVPDDQKSRIFNRFHRVAEAGRESAQRGVGLGLAICREIVEAHTGEVTVRDNEGGGSVFTVALPIADPATAVDAASGAALRQQSVGA